MIRRILSTTLCLCLLMLSLPALAEDTGDILVRLADDDPRPALGDPALLEVHFINVASADCILLRMGEETMMIDSGNPETADRILAYLETIDVDHLDYAFLSHPHTDHLGGYITVLDEIPVGVFLTDDFLEAYPSEPAKALRALLQEKDIPVLTVVGESTLTFGDTLLSFYQWTDEKGSTNDRSMIAKLQYGDRSILFAADVENNGQFALAEQYGNRLSADILKMPHHGLAAYMREFHAAVNPVFATFSNTKSNIERTYTLTQQRGVDVILVTKGTVVAVTDGEGPWQIWQIMGNPLQESTS